MAREVSNRVPIGLLDAVARRGVDPERLLAGSPLDRNLLRDRRGRCDWDAFALFLDRLEKEVGGPDAFEQLAFEMIVAHPAMRLIGSLFVSPRTLMLQASERVMRRLYHCDLGLRSELCPDGSYRFEYSIPDELRASEPFFHATAGAHRAYPQLIGLPPARVAAEIGPRRAVLRVTLAPSRTRLARTRQLLAGPLSRWFSASGMGVPEPTPADVQDAIEMAFDGAPLAENTERLGQQLARHTELRELAEELQKVLASRLCSSRLRLSFSADDGTERASELGGPGAFTTLPLIIGGELVGELGVDVSCAGSMFLEALLPWVALGIESCRRAGAGDGVARRMERRARAWELTPRQTQILELVVRGLSNKEIATALDCSLKTVEAHVGQVLRKAASDSRTALAARFWDDARDPASTGAPRGAIVERVSRPR